MMKNLLIVSSLALIVSACGSLKGQNTVELEKTDTGIPEWYTKEIKEPNALYGVAAESSSDLQFAVDKAMLSAKRELASNFSSEVDAMLKDFSAEVGTKGEVMNDINRTTKMVVNRVNLIGVTRSQFVIFKTSDSKYRVFVQLRYATDDSNKILLEEIRKNQRLNLKLQSSKSFKELEERVNGKVDAQ